MNKLIEKQSISCITYASLKYWTEESKLEKTFKEIEKNISEELDSVVFFRITNEADLSKVLLEDKNSTALMIPLSGSVQTMMLKATNIYKAICICPGYDKRIISTRRAKQVLEKNAAPAFMDFYSVIKQKGVLTQVFKGFFDLNKLFRAARAADRLNGAKILLIGETESWVISATRNLDIIEQNFGVKVVHRELSELYSIYKYNKIQDKENDYSNKWIKLAKGIKEPNNSDISNASILTSSIMEMVKQYDCDAVVLACFSLLNQFGTTGCMALSELNDSINYIGGCEGDLDSGLTLMLMKAISDKPGWMANPIVMDDNIVQLSHCSAPLNMNGKNKSEFVLRSHHESGIGVSPQVKLDNEEIITLCRVGKEMSAINLFIGKTVIAPRLPVCRTQVSVVIDSTEEYLESVLGCHLIITYGDYTEELKYFAKLKKLEIL